MLRASTPNSRLTRRVWLAIWITLIVVVVVPWGTLEPHPHWERMEWIPFVSPPVDIGDVIANLLFYVPYGMLVGREEAHTRGAILLAAGSATVLSLATEFTQIFSNSRFPSMTDVALSRFFRAGIVAGGIEPRVCTCTGTTRLHLASDMVQVIGPEFSPGSLQ